MSLLNFLPIVGKVLDRVIPDKNARAQAEEELQAATQSGELNLLLGQIAINKQEAAHKSIFVAGWRPFVGWVCGFGLAYNIILSPFLAIWLTVPAIDTSLLYPALMGILGLGAARSYEKIKGVARER